ncbi:MAG: GtrA family protein [Legionella sp.]|nr:GtrA family protein [Legionella sp.]
MIASSKLNYQMFYFFIIGIFAASLHLGIVFILTDFMDIRPLIGNVFAFFIAFNFSYLGHKYLTFSKLPNEKKLSLPHFFMVSGSAGLLNEVLYFIFLRFIAINYLLALFCVLGLVAIYTFILSRCWACR